MAIRQSAGIVLFRRPGGSRAEPEILLGHPGGPFFARRDAGHWTVPKGEPDDPADDLLAVARREFTEEIGHPPPMTQPDGSPPIPLGSIVQKGGKVVHAWAFEGDCDADAIRSNTFAMEWPPRSGRQQEFPEVDRAGWFDLETAKEKILKGQLDFIRRLGEMLRP